MRKRRVGRGKYYTAIYDSARKESCDFLLSIMRNDTAELVATWSVSQEKMQELNALLDGLPPPEDWREPYRKCLGYFINKNEIIQEMMSFREKERVNLNRLVWRRGNYFFHALRMLHDLDAQQIKKLLSLTDREKGVVLSGDLEVSTFINMDVTYGRVRLYNMFFKKNRGTRKIFPE